MNLLNNHSTSVAMTVDDSGSIYITGNFTDTLIFGQDTLKSLMKYIGGNMNMFLVKYNSGGNVVWAKQTNNKYSGVTPTSLTTNPSHTLFVTGGYFDSALFGPLLLTHPTTSMDETFLVTYDGSNGNPQWAVGSVSCDKNCGSGGNRVITDQAGNIYILGEFHGGTSFGAYSLNGSRTSEEIYLAKYNPTGKVLWVRQSACNNCYYVYNSAASLVIDANNNIYLSVTDDGGGGVVNFCNYTSYSQNIIYEIDTAGNGKCIDSNKTAAFNSLAITPSGSSVYVSGALSDTVIFNNDTLRASFKIYGHGLPYVAKWYPCFTVGINDTKKPLYSVSVYPNPSGGKLKLAVSSQGSIVRENKIEIYNVYGQEVYSCSLNNLSRIHFGIQNSTLSIDLSAEPSGVYFYRVLEGNNNLIGEGKFVIEK